MKIMATAWSPRRFTPLHLRVCTFYWSGMDQGEIAAACGISQQHVSRILETPQAQEILGELSSRTIDTVVDVQTTAQAFAPACLDGKMHLAMNAKDERVRNVACSDILAIAGHQPVRRVSFERPDSLNEKFSGLSDEQIKAALMEELGIQPETSDKMEGETIH